MTGSGFLFFKAHVARLEKYTELKLIRIAEEKGLVFTSPFFYQLQFSMLSLVAYRSG